MDQWLSEGLSKLLDFEVPEDLTKYISSIDKEKDLDEYLKTFLDFDNSQHKNFYLELVKKKFPNRAGSQSKQQKKKISKNKNQQEFVSTETPIEPPVEVETKSKKKTKYVNLYSQEGKNAQIVFLKGRHHCDCQASKHELVNNCLKCGRVVCKQEGSGPCLFCGNLVCTPEEQREINAKTKSSAKLVESLMERSRPKGWEAAMSQRNRLLEYDRTSERRTRVTDDDSDYFSSNSVWLSASERDSMNAYQKKLHDKKHASRLDKKMTFDFAGRQIVEDNTIDYEVDEEQIRQITSNKTSSSSQFLRPDLLLDSSGDRDVAPGVNAPLLQFDESVDKGQSTPRNCSQLSRIQDASLQEMGDAGRCLSMHQPWASLLVEGIKLHEGRTWYSSHRGRLWIASTARALEPNDARILQQQYEAMYPDKLLKFPSFYPTGCLLGCVIVEDCLSQEEYAKKYPGGESDSPYVFICSNPISLRLRFPIKGQHKIYSLDKTIHQAAVKSIQKMAKIQAKEANAGHEGRTWYSSHRGRLWIASTARALEPNDARILQQQYEAMYPDKLLKFPSFYPTGCLLGCVIVEDCLSQEEYAKKYPGGESDSPYVFICSNPISLRLRFPIKGQHKIYSLDKTIHQAAVKSIQKMAKIQAKEANAG